MIVLRPLFTRLAVFAGLCLLAPVWLDTADAAQARQPRRAIAPRKCTCDDKAAMQRDIDDMRWLAMRHREKAAEMEAQEGDIYKRMGRSLGDRSGEMDALWTSYNGWESGTGPNTARSEFQGSRNYQGSVVVTFDQKTNQPDPAQLQAARRLAVCLAIADGITLHEKAHSDVRAAGGGNYSRPSQLAREEANHYDAEADSVERALNALNCPRAELSGVDTGERFAQRERLRHAVERVSAYAESLS